MNLKHQIYAVLFLFAACCAAGVEQKKVLVAAAAGATEFSEELLKKDASVLLEALEKAGAASGTRESVSSTELLKKEGFEKAAYNHLVLIGRKGTDPLLEKCWGHQAAIDPETKTFYRLGYGTLRGDIGYVECDWNPFLFSNKVRTNSFTTVIVKISGTSDAGVRAALEAFRKGLLNGIVPAGKVERVTKSILDRDPDSTPPPNLPRKVRAGEKNAYLSGWTQPSEEEYRAFLDVAGVMPLRMWRVKYLADGALEDVSARAWVNGLHRLAYGNSVMIAEFADASGAEKTFRALSRVRGAKREKVGYLELVTFDQPRDEAFDKSYGKIHYLRKGALLYAVSLPESAIPSIIR